MINRLELVLNTDKKMDYNIGSVLHGVLMENVNRDYGDYLHNSRLNPFSQHVYPNSNGNIIWRINTLDKDAYDNLIVPLQNKDKLFLKQRNQEVEVIKKITESTSAVELIKEYYKEQKQQSIYNLQFVTPTNFKLQGEYQLFPELKAIYRNVMNRFDEFSDEYKIFDEDALNHLIQRTRIVDFRLKSQRFYLEKTRIPGYVGNIKVSVKGSSAMESLVGLIFSYSEFSGIGIKTSIGMGGTKLVK